MANIFISYSSKDKKFASKLAHDLEELAHIVWLDEWEIKVGECIVTKIEEGLSISDYVIIVLTPDSVSSGWVEKEWKTAYWKEIEEKKIIVLPLLLKTCNIPLLLKTKKYADFRKNCTVGFAKLVQSIVPADFEEDKLMSVQKTKKDKEVSELIAKVQEKQTTLSQCIVEALNIAQVYDDRELVEFCKNELTGWKGKEIPEDKKVHYRLIEIFCSPYAKINPQYFGWGENISNMFAFMEEHPDHFFPLKTFLTMPISELERKKSSDPKKTFLAWTMPITSILPDSKDPDAKVYCYARASSTENVIEAVRTELTKKLINLLPKIEIS